MDEKSVKITLALIDQFLEDMHRRGSSRDTLKKYRRDLRAMYGFLPEDKLLTRERFAEWCASLREAGYAERSIASCMAVGNSFLKFLDCTGWRISTRSLKEEPPQPEITRAEYLRLLQTAKEQRRERAYFVVLAICGIGVPVREMPFITVESVLRGEIEIKGKGERHAIRIPPSIQSQLLEYVKREGLTEGSIFVSKNGVPLGRTQIWLEVQKLCKAANVPEEKANPRCLLRLHQNTYDSVRANLSLLIEQAYNHILEEEQSRLDWMKI